jgi:hypothetical protein
MTKPPHQRGLMASYGASAQPDQACGLNRAKNVPNMANEFDQGSPCG